MGNLIDRQDAKDAVDMALDTIDHVPEWVYDILLNSLDKVPSAEPERKKGKWIKIEPQKKGKWIANGDIHKECPFCGEDWDKYVFGEVWYTDELPKFCPNCGADMREGEEE